MPAMQVIETTKTLWAVPPQMPPMLRSPSELDKAGQGEQSRANSCCNCKGSGCAKQGIGASGIEITTSSFYFKGFE